MTRVRFHEKAVANCPLISRVTCRMCDSGNPSEPASTRLLYPARVCLLWYTHTQYGPGEAPYQGSTGPRQRFPNAIESTVEVQKYRLNVEIEPPFASAALAGPAGGHSPTTMGPATANMLATANALACNSWFLLTSPPCSLGDRVVASMFNVLNISPSPCIMNSMAMTSYPLGCGPALPDPRGRVRESCEPAGFSF